MKIPGKGEVDRALKQTQRQVKSALRQVNQVAGRLVARGDYTGAHSWVDVGRSITTFGTKLDALQQEWQSLHTEIPAQHAVERTPLWEYYRPILKALVQLGGEAYVAEVEEATRPFLADILGPEEMTMMTGGKLIWKRAIRRARRHMIREGFLEAGTALRWKITTEGKRAADEKLSSK